VKSHQKPFYFRNYYHSRSFENLDLFLITVVLLVYILFQSSIWEKISVWELAYAQINNSTVKELIPSELFAKVERSVVQITVANLSGEEDLLLNNGQDLISLLGSGFLYKDGYVVTNSHVVSLSDTADVTFIDGNVYSARVVGKDPYANIAVLKLDENALNEEKVSPLPIANSSLVKVGDPVAVIGNPFGLSGSMTTGIISQVGRLLPEEVTGFSIPSAIQIDAAINPGNSGGPLLNYQGEVIGVTTAIFSNTGSFSGVGFAIPSNSIVRIVPQLILHGTYDHPWLGMGGLDITPSIAKRLGLKDAKGVLVLSINANSPADLAGLHAVRQGFPIEKTGINRPDIIYGIDGKQMRKMQDIIAYVDGKTVGDTISFQILRNGLMKKIDLTLSARPSNQ
jgi:S1-C subfamily serine protease